MVKTFFKLALIVGPLTWSVAFATEYHQPDLFPIGFSGFSYTGLVDPVYGNPYGEGEYNTWAKEESLLVRTHCNFIGCSDAWHRFDKYITLNYTELENQTI